MESKGENQQRRDYFNQIKNRTQSIKYSTLYMTGKHPTGFSDQWQTPENVEHVVVYGPKYEIKRIILVKKDMAEIGLTGRGLKNILEYSRSGQGIKYCICF